MRLEIERSDQAETDLDEIWMYVAERNEPAADRLLLRILDVLRELAQHPDMGKERPDLGEGVRSFVVTPNFGIFYSRTSTTLRLLRVMRFSRDINAQMFES